MERSESIRIIGQGLAGSLLAFLLEQRGIPFTVQDLPLDGAATAVAPGILNPLAGRNFQPPEQLPELISASRETLHTIEAVLGLRIWTACPILRMFSDPVQVDRFRKGLTPEEHAAYVDREYPPNAFPELNDVFGSFLTKGGGWANLPLLLEGTRAWLRQSGRLEETEWTPEQPVAPGERLVFCEGWQISRNPAWSFIPHNPAKGEMLIVRFREPLPRDRIYNQSCWIQPIEEDLWRVGATYSWSAFGSQPSHEGARDLRERLTLLTPLPFEVLDQRAGVRPIVEDYRPVVGRHPEHRHWYVLNALGSKGVLQAPAAASALLDHLLDHSPLPPAWNVARFS